MKAEIEENLNRGNNSESRFFLNVVTFPGWRDVLIHV